MRSIKITILCLLALAALPWALSAQSYDSSGDGMLSGTYYLRQVIYFIQTSESPEGTVGEAINTYGNITFDGNGNYSFSGWFLDAENSSSAPVQFTSAGTYVVSASGEGYITAVNPEVNGTDLMVGLVSPKGIFVGSSTGNTEGYNDLVIAAPVGSSQATNATLNGSYQIAYMDPTYAGDALLTLTSGGNGNIGTVSANELIGTNSAITQTLGNVTYSFTNGAANVNFGANPNSNLIGGTELLYISPDGNFVFGGSANAFDMFVGVRNANSDPSNYDALYYQAGIDLDLTDISNGFVFLDSYYGSVNGFFDDVNGHQGLGHQSLNSQLIYGGTADNTYWDFYMLNGDGSSSDNDFSQTYWSSSDGTIRVGYSPVAGVLSLNVALQAPLCATPTNCGGSSDASSVYLNPQGIINAASSSPFTAHLSPGEFLTLLGTNLAAGAASATTLPLPDKLNNVSVTINDIQAPIQFVSPGQINVVVPFDATQAVATIQVNNNGTLSNTITQFIGATSAGVFTVPEGGIGDAAAQDVTANYALVTEDNPAQIGDLVAVYLAGLGSVSGNVTDGQAGPSNPVSNAVNTPEVWIDDVNGASTQATVAFAGLAPGFAGLYQIDFTVPSGVASGDDVLEIIGPDSDTTESGFPVGAPETAVSPAARAKAVARARLMRHHRMVVRPAAVSASK
jgi:uncharacterized protein (TIGR03437 family)